MCCKTQFLHFQLVFRFVVAVVERCVATKNLFSLIDFSRNCNRFDGMRNRFSNVYSLGNFPLRIAYKEYERQTYA